MGRKDIDIEGGMRRLAEQRIEDAMRDGKFSNLPGMGRPLDLEPIPAGENARLTWWALRILKQNDYTPDEVRWLRQVDLLKEELAAAQTEVRVRAIVKTLNALVHRINTLGTNAINARVAPVDLESELRRVRMRLHE
jgi:hypothetical protein